jgi:hypothetical protein
VPEEFGRYPQRGEPFCATQNSTNKGHPGVLWTPEGIGRCPQRDDLSCASGTTQHFMNEGYDPKGFWPQPAGRRRAVRKWHGTRETSSGETGARKSPPEGTTIEDKVERGTQRMWALERLWTHQIGRTGPEDLRGGSSSRHRTSNAGICGGVDPLRSARSNGARRTGYGEPRPLQELAPHGCESAARERERERASECETQRSRMSTIGTDEHLFREPLGTSWLKGGADVAVIPQVTRRNRYTGNWRTHGRTRDC